MSSGRGGGWGHVGRFAPILVGAALAAWVPPAFAAGKDADKAACAAAYDQAQTSRAAGKLGVARRAAATCTADVCAEFIRTDCTKWLSEIDASQPTVTFEVHGPDGRETTAVRVSLDGQPWLDSLDARAKPIDPGQHTLRFEIAGAPAIEDSVQVREGEKFRKLSMSFQKPAEAAPSLPGAALPGPVPATSASAGQDGQAAHPTWPWIVGGGGVASVGVGVGFLVASIVGQNDISNNCGKGLAGYGADQCASMGSSNNLKQVAFGVAGGAGAIAIGAAIWGFVREPGAQNAKASMVWEATPLLGGGVFGLEWRGRF